MGGRGLELKYATESFLEVQTYTPAHPSLRYSTNYSIAIYTSRGEFSLSKSADYDPRSKKGVTDGSYAAERREGKNVHLSSLPDPRQYKSYASSALEDGKPHTNDFRNTISRRNRGSINVEFDPGDQGRGTNQLR